MQPNINTGNTILNSILAPYLEPALQMQQTQASTALTGQETANAAQQNILQQQAIGKQTALADAGNTLTSSADPKTGRVSPQIYNQVKQKAISIANGPDSGEFDSKYMKFTDPASIDYNTEPGLAGQKEYGIVKSSTQSLLNEYQAIPKEQLGPDGAYASTLFWATHNPLSRVLGDNWVNKQVQNAAPEAFAYEQRKLDTAASLKSLAGAGAGQGVRTTQYELQNFADLPPDVINNDTVNTQKIKNFDQMLKTGYHTDTGLDSQYMPSTKSSQSSSTTNRDGQYTAPQQTPAGDVVGNIISTLYPGLSNKGLFSTGGQPNVPAQIGQNVVNDVTGMGQGLYNNAKQAVQTGVNVAQSGAPLQTILPAIAGQQIMSQGQGLLNTANQIQANPLQFLTQHPISTALPFIGLGAGLKGEGAIPSEGEASIPKATDTSAPSTTLSTNPLMDFINPKGRIQAQGNFRTNLVDQATTAGKILPADTLNRDITNWAKTAKRGNLGQGGYIDQAVADAKQAFQGNLTPKELMDAYNEADSGYTKNGIQKTPIQANVDRGLRDIIGKRLNQVAPGWQNATSEMARGYQSIKNPHPIRSMVGRVAPFAAAAALGPELGRIIFGH